MTQKMNLSVLTIALLALVGVLVTQARPSSEVERVYFSGPDFKKEVGYMRLPCNGGKIVKGKQTLWRYETKASCDPQGPYPVEQCMVCEPGFVNCIKMTCPPGFAIKDQYDPKTHLYGQ